MSKQPQDDYFAPTTMSFGEHLEELRASLFKALSGLMVGFILGLLLANYVVAWIQSPLQTALEDYYVRKAIKNLKEDYPGGVTPEVEEFIADKRFVFEKIYVEADEFARVGKLLSQLPAGGSAGAKSESSPSQSDKKEPSAEEEPAKPEEMRHENFPHPELMKDPPAPSAVMAATRVWRPINMMVKSLSAHEVFMIWLKAGLIAGAIISSPWMFWHVWQFVAAGLYPHERQYVHLYLPFSIVLFLLGAGTAFFFVFQPVLEFLFSFNEAMNIDPDPRISEWLSFVLFLPLGFGLAFQLPLVMLFLHRIGLVSVQTYLEKWRVAILVIFVISMFLTPADPISMLLMAVPVTGLYFFGIGLCRWMPRGRNPFDEVYEP